jgi:hypothetical protein
MLHFEHIQKDVRHIMLFDVQINNHAYARIYLKPAAATSAALTACRA